MKAANDTKSELQKAFAFVITGTALIFSLIACDGEEGRFLPTPSTASVDLIAIMSYDPDHAGVTLYDIDGNFVRHLGDFRSSPGGTPRGMIQYDSETFLVTMDAPDQIWTITYEGVKTIFSGNSNFAGTIYGLAASADGQHFYSFESNNIEKFEFDDGTLVSNDYIATTVGSCTLSNPRAMTITPEGYIAVANNAGVDAILRIDDTGDTPACISSVAFGNNPYGLLYHSDGNLYVTTQGDDAIYVADPDGNNATQLWTPDTSIIDTPTDIVELPNGDLLVASTGTNSIERIGTDGVRVGSDPFIQDVYSSSIYEIIVIDVED